MGKRLLSAFAAENPERFAQVLGESRDIEQSVAILRDIPDGMEGEIAARLNFEAAGRLMNGLPDELLSIWLSGCSPEAGRRVLSRISTERANTLINAIEDRSKRRGLRRLLTYPAGSVGETMQPELATINQGTVAGEIAEQIRRQGGTKPGPVAILRDDGTVMGILDLARFLRNAEATAQAKDFCIAVKPVFAESPMNTLRTRKEWSQLNALPVVDQKGRAIGYVTLEAVSESLGLQQQTNLIQDSFILVSSRFLDVLAHVLVMVLSRRVKS